jgi:hypothetical protein
MRVRSKDRDWRIPSVSGNLQIVKKTKNHIEKLKFATTIPNSGQILAVKGPERRGWIASTEIRSLRTHDHRRKWWIIDVELRQLSGNIRKRPARIGRMRSCWLQDGCQYNYVTDCEGNKKRRLDLFNSEKSKERYKWNGNKEIAAGRKHQRAERIAQISEMDDRTQFLEFNCKK